MFAALFLIVLVRIHIHGMHDFIFISVHCHRCSWAPSQVTIDQCHFDSHLAEMGEITDIISIKLMA